MEKHDGLGIVDEISKWVWGNWGIGSFFAGKKTTGADGSDVEVERGRDWMVKDNTIAVNWAVEFITKTGSSFTTFDHPKMRDFIKGQVEVMLWEALELMPKLEVEEDSNRQYLLEADDEEEEEEDNWVAVKAKNLE